MKKFQRKMSEDLSEPMTESSKESLIYLQPQLTLLNGISIIVGSIIGSGIFVSPKGVLEGTGSVGLSLIIWVVCGLYTMLGAYCYAELGCMITKTGGDYTYIKEAFGSFLAFMRLWVECIIVRPCTLAVLALTFSHYVLHPIFEQCHIPFLPVYMIAILGLTLITFFNCYSVHLSTFVQDFCTVAKLSALGLIIVSGMVRLYYGHTQNLNFESHRDVQVVDIALSFYGGLFAYNGWTYLNYLITEMKNPIRDLPISICVSCITATVVYTLTIVAYHSTLTVEEMLESKAVAVTYGERLFGDWKYAFSFFVAISTFGSINGVLLSTSRLFFSGAEQGHMPKILSMIQMRRLTPSPSVIFTTAISCLFLLYRDVYALINCLGFANWLAIGTVVFCVPFFRMTRPNAHRPIRVHILIPIVYILMTIFILGIPLVISPKETGVGALLVCTGIPAYFLFIYKDFKPLWCHKGLDNMELIFQKILMVVPSEKEMIIEAKSIGVI